MEPEEFIELPEKIKEKITEWLKSQRGLSQLFLHAPIGTDDREHDSMMLRLVSDKDMGETFQNLPPIQTSVVASYLLAEAYNPRSYAHVGKNPERSFEYYADIARVVDTPEVWLRMGQMHWDQRNYKDAYYSFDAATSGQTKLLSGVNVHETAAHWLRNRAFLESAAAQETNDYRAAKMLERYIYRLDGSLRQSETFEEAEYHLKKIRQGKTPDPSIELQVFGGVELLKNSPVEQAIFFRELEAHIATFEIMAPLPDASLNKETLKNGLVRDGRIIEQLNKMGLCNDKSAYIEKIQNLVSNGKSDFKPEQPSTPYYKTKSEFKYH
ncbi:TPA: hypothetical protein ACF3I9_004484 [Klebsiella aerogenes]